MATTIPAPPPPEIPAPSKSFLSRFAGIYFSPGETFEDVARKPDFILPLLVTVSLSVIGTETFLAKIGIEPVVRWAMQHGSRPVPPDQIDSILAKLVPFQTIAAHIVGVVWVPLVTLIVAVIGLIALNSIFGAKISFKTAFSVPAYAYLVNVVYSLISIAMVLLGDPEHFISNPQNPSPTHLGFFVDPLQTSRPLLALASSVELFTFWYVALLAIGFSVASGKKVKPLTAFFVFFVPWAIGVLIKTGLQSLG